MTSTNDDDTNQQPPQPPQPNNQNYHHEPTSPHFQPRYTGPSPSSLTSEQQTLRRSILTSRPHTGLSGPFGPWLAIPSIARPSQELGRVVRYETSLSMRESELVILLTGAKFKSEAEFDIHVGEARRAGVGWDVICSIPRGEFLLSEEEEEERIESHQNARKDESRMEFSLENVKKHVIPMLEKEHDDDDGDVKQEQENNSLSPSPLCDKTKKKREVAIVLFAAELLDGNTVSDETYATTKEILDGNDSVLVEITSIIGYYAYVAYTLNVFKIASAVKPSV